MQIVKRLLVTLIIAAGLVALLTRLATPLLSGYRDDIATLVGNQLGMPVSIGQLQARWYGFSPVLELRDVRIGTPPQVINAARVAFTLAPAQLLGTPSLQGLQVIIDRMRITVVREPSGQVHLEGIGSIGAPGSGSGSDSHLPARIGLINASLVWVDRKAGKAPIALHNVTATLDQGEGVFRIRTSLESAAGSAELSIDADRPPLSTDWNGETYLRVENLDVARLFAHYLPAAYGLDALQLELESWSSWRDAAHRESVGRFGLTDLKLGAPDRPGALHLRDARGEFTTRRIGSAVKVGVRGLELGFGDHDWPASDLALSVDRDTGVVDAYAGYLQIEDLARILDVRMPSPALRESIEQLQPRGLVRNLRLTTQAAGSGPSWRARARFEQVSTAPWGRVPGVNNLSGGFSGDPRHAVLDLDSSHTTLLFNELFRDPLELTTLEGRIDIETGPDGWQTRCDRLVANAPHLHTLNRFFVSQLPGQSLFVDVQTDFRDGDAAFASRYYPAGIMGEHLVNWLDRSIRSGRVPSGTALIHGPIEDFAFDKTMNGTFQVVFDTESVDIDYQPGWPPLENVDARVRFRGNQLDIRAEAGNIYDSRASGVEARIGSLDPIAPLEVKGRLDGPLRNSLRILQEEALNARYGQFAGALSGDGDTALLLDFRIPLGLGNDDYALDGRLEFSGNTLRLPAWDLALNNIDGALMFTLDGLRARDIQAQVLGTPVSVDVIPVAEGTTRVRTRGKLAVDDIAGQFDISLPTAARGSSDFTVDVDIPGNTAADDRPAWLRVESDLVGIAIDLPRPFGKTIDAARHILLEIPLSDGMETGSLNYDNQVMALFSADGSRFNVDIGGATERLQAQPGVLLRGRLEHVDIEQWMAAVDRLAPGGDGSVRVPLDIRLDLGRLAAGGTRFDDVTLHVTRSGRAWQGEIESRDLAGNFEIPEDLGRDAVIVRLNRLRLLRSPETAPGSGSAATLPESAADPTALPAMSLRIDDVTVNQAQLGQFELGTRKTGHGLEIETLKLTGGELLLDGKGSWGRSGDGFATQIGGTVQTSDIGGLLEGLGYARQVEEAGGSIDFLLNWPGNPAQLSSSTVEGKMALAIASGRLPELDPGATRVVGLMNLNALARRLRLDFSDIYRKGFSFDRISGDFVFHAGTAKTDNLVVQGPTGRIELDGTADMRRETLRQHVTVIPNLDATLPIAGTLAGGPIAGVAVLVAQRVLAAQVDNINRFEYRLTGPWTEPAIEQLDSGGTLSKLMRPLNTLTQPAGTAQPDESTDNLPPRAGVRPSETGLHGKPLDQALRGLLDRIRRPGTETYDPLQQNN